MLDSITKLLAQLSAVFLVLSLVTGIIQCFFGYRLLKFWITLFGFLLGFLLGYGISGQLVSDSAVVPVLAGIAAGLLAGFLAFKIYLLGVFVFCGLLGFYLVSAISFPSGDGWTVLAFILEIVAFVAVGILSVKFARPFIIVITAGSGAFSAVRALASLTPSVALLQVQSSRLIILLVLAACGIMLQFLMTAEDSRPRAAGRRR